MSWVQGIVQFFNYLAWTLYVIGLIVACFECGINYAGGKGDIRAVALNAIKGFMAASLFSVVPVRLYQLAISLQAEFTSGMTGYGTSIGGVAANIIQEYEEIETVADLVMKPISGFEAVTSAIMVDRLRLRQQKGYLSTCPQGHNIFGTQFERVLPASSVANLYIYNYSGKTDAHGFYIGKDRYGSNILTDFDQRDEDKTSANVLILGNSGQGKSYLMKLLMVNCREAGKNIISLDVEHEQGELCAALDGCFIDLMGGQYIINVLEPKCWSTGEDEDDPSTPETFKKKTVLSQHLSFLRDFFRAYKDFTDPQIDTIEILLSKLYSKFHISDYTNFSQLKPEDYPVLSDLYDLIEEEHKNYDEAAHNLYTPQLLQEVLLGLNSICKGADSQFFNGHTNITSSRFLVFGVKSLLMAGRNIQNAMLFNILSYMSDRLLTEGNTVATLDELYIWLSNPTAIEYIRNCLKRVRKKESAMILASQNLDDFDQPNVREMTKPLFSIPPHQFLFNAGSIDKRSYMDMLQLEESEYDLIRYPQRGVCLYKCGNERYLLEVHVPPHKEALFGTAGGR